LFSPEAAVSADLNSWDGAAESIHAQKNMDQQLSVEEEAWRNAYYHDVILPDEKRFLVSPAGEHLKIVSGVTGRKTVFIEDGKGMVEIPEEIMDVWKSYEARGKESKGQ
jgi:hypothetical protein